MRTNAIGTAKPNRANSIFVSSVSHVGDMNDANRTEEPAAKHLLYSGFLLHSSQKDLSATAADQLCLAVADRHRLHCAAGRTTEKPFLPTITQAISNTFLTFQPKRTEPQSHFFSRV